MTNNIQRISNWFETAVPSPDKTNLRIQSGVVVEEFLETLTALIPPVEIHGRVCDFSKSRLSLELSQFSHDLKTVPATEFLLENPDRLAVLDGIADTIVTLVGLAHMLGMDIDGALGEVARSNESKFVDGRPVFDKDGKITKGPYYSKPELGEFLSKTVASANTSAFIYNNGIIACQECHGSRDVYGYMFMKERPWASDDMCDWCGSKTETASPI